MAANYYDSDRGISEYLTFHYGGFESRVPATLNEALRFPVRCVTECLDATRLPRPARALDLGCAVGRSAFELARHCEQVVAIDYSARFINVANHLRDNGSFGFSYIVEGELTQPHQAVLPAEIERRRVAFSQGDACALPDGLGQFDVVLMANLIDRVREPKKCLQQLPKLIQRGGQLIITSPYTWMEEYTPRENQLGGFIRDGRAVQTFDALQECLAPAFRLARRQDLPFVLREHARKFQLGFADATTWVRE
jgi:putative 4-mercaptohistidine N1-methyltranferase